MGATPPPGRAGKPPAGRRGPVSTQHDSYGNEVAVIRARLSPERRAWRRSGYFTSSASCTSGHLRMPSAGSMTCGTWSAIPATLVVAGRGWLQPRVQDSRRLYARFAATSKRVASSSSPPRFARSWGRGRSGCCPVRERFIQTRRPDASPWGAPTSRTGWCRWLSSSSWSRSSNPLRPVELRRPAWSVPGRDRRDLPIRDPLYGACGWKHRGVLRSSFHCLIVDEVRRRIIDKRLLALVRSLRAGVMTETGRLERTLTGTPQGGIASPTAR